MTASPSTLPAREAIASGPRATLTDPQPCVTGWQRRKRRLRRLLAQIIARAVPRGVFTDPQNFSLWERRGFHVLPATFYSPVPNVAELRRRPLPRCSAMSGIEMNDAAQQRLLNEISAYAEDEADDLLAALATAAAPSAGYSGADMMIYYALLRRLRPAQIIEVGAGASTFIAGHALQRNATDAGTAPADFTSIDPYPHPAVRSGVPCLARLVAEPVQDVPHERFQMLAEGDVLFIDSTHVCKIGSDVNYLVLEILPRLGPGVWVHFHDIFLPQEYPDQWWRNETHRFWNEQYLLQAFLAFNAGYEVMLAANYARSRWADGHPALFRSRDDHRAPGGFWIRRTTAVFPTPSLPYLP